MIEKQQEKVQVCENNWVRRIVGLKTVDQRGTEELRGEAGVRNRGVEAGGWCEERRS